MSDRIFFKTVIQIEVLSEDPFEWDSLNDIKYAITHGPCSGEVIEKARYKLTGKQVAKALRKQGSDPSFFNLDDHGNQTEWDT